MGPLIHRDRREGNDYWIPRQERLKCSTCHEDCAVEWQRVEAEWRKLSVPIPTVRIRGDGIAASCCARLLEHAGLDLIIERSSRVKLPAVMLGETTQKLLRDIF